jgi:hypothetical protein
MPAFRQGRSLLSTSVVRTDQDDCYGVDGAVVPCLETGIGQDGAAQAGVPWPEPRFSQHDQTVVDHLTGLVWTHNAGLAEYPLMWQEALDYVAAMNLQETYGFNDWRLPNRKELFGLVSHVRINPCLPKGHPFANVFAGYYWTSTTVVRLPRQAWYVHFGGGRVVKGMKHGSYMIWPVRGRSGGLVQIPRSGQKECYDTLGRSQPCASSGQDGACQEGSPWPEPRFVALGGTVLDSLTGLVWTKEADCTSTAVNWEWALETIREMNSRNTHGHDDWRLPNIRELESLTDMGSHSPALPHGNPFQTVQPFYWSSTTSTYDPRYAWGLYLEDGTVGVAFKKDTGFHVWAVRDGQCGDQ